MSSRRQVWLTGTAPRGGGADSCWTVFTSSITSSSSVTADVSPDARPSRGAGHPDGRTGYPRARAVGARVPRAHPRGERVRYRSPRPLYPSHRRQRTTLRLLVAVGRKILATIHAIPKT